MSPQFMSKRNFDLGESSPGMAIRSLNSDDIPETEEDFVDDDFVDQGTIATEFGSRFGGIPATTLSRPATARNGQDEEIIEFLDNTDDLIELLMQA